MHYISATSLVILRVLVCLCVEGVVVRERERCVIARKTLFAWDLQGWLVFFILLALLYTCQLFLMQRGETFIRILCNHCAHIQKCLIIFRKFTKTIQTFLKIRWSSSELGARISFAKHNLFSFENRRIFREELSFTHTFQSVIASSTNYTLTYYIFTKFLSDMAATTHTFQLGVRNWSVGVI